jgi:hypothetical protein
LDPPFVAQQLLRVGVQHNFMPDGNFQMKKKADAEYMYLASAICCKGIWPNLAFLFISIANVTLWSCGFRLIDSFFKLVVKGVR